MQTRNLIKAAILAVALVAGFVIFWELKWRSKGFIPTYNDDKVLWANARKDVYDKDATVFIGSSRIKYDLDIPTWENITGEKAVQLALVGTSPRLLLQDLANDENFKGRLVLDVTEILFFSQNPVFQKSSREAIAFYKDQTPSQKFSAAVNFAVESKLTFLEEQNFSLTALLNDMEVPNRPGVFSFPVFPKGFGWTTEDRQTYMSAGFLADQKALKRQTDIWNILLMSDPTPLPTAEQTKAIFEEVKTAIEKINRRGGKVVFVRTPSNGPLADMENQKYPRAQYWDALLSYSHTPGLHFSDHPGTAELICPEWSHLTKEDAITYTKELIGLLRKIDWF